MKNGFLNESKLLVSQILLGLGHEGTELTWNILEQELMDSNDNHVFEVTNLKSIIVELQEKLEYDCRRLNREFSEKLDNVYECIEKLEIGREKKLNKGMFYIEW